MNFILILMQKLYILVAQRTVQNSMIYYLFFFPLYFYLFKLFFHFFQLLYYILLILLQLLHFIIYLT